MNLSQQQSHKVSKAQPFADNSSKNLYYQNQNPSKSYANLRFNHTNGQFPSHTVGNNSFILSSKKQQEVRERKVSETIPMAESKNIPVIYNSTGNQDSGGKSQAILNRTHFWDHLLLSSSEERHYHISDDQVILNSTLDLQNQMVIRQDTKRTHCGKFDGEMQVKLEHFLTFYCKQQDIKYKQGLNELAAPFLYLTKQPNSNVTIAQSYNYFINFLDKFVPNFFQDSEFNSLQCFFFAFTLLMKYHDPNLNNFLQKNDITPEIYAYPWFITLFSRALEIRKQTPISFNSRINQLNVLQKNYHKHQSTMQEMKQAAGQISKYVAMPISPIEILHHLYPSVIQCPNPECEKNSFLEKIMYLNSNDQAPQQNNLINQQQQNLFKTFHGGDWNQDGKNRTEDIGRGLSNNRSKECKYCSIKVLIPNDLNNYVNKSDFLREVIEISKQNSIKVYKDKLLDFKTFDLRIQSKNQGYLNKTTLVSMNKFDQETLDSLISDYIEYKNISHFSFLVSDYSTIDQDFSHNQSLLYVDTKQQEIYTVQKFSSDFIEYGFPYISIVEGGFKICHDIILYQGLKMNDHNVDLCKYCLRQNQYQQPRKQPNSILDFFTNVFSSKDASQVGQFTGAGVGNTSNSMNANNIQHASSTTNNLFQSQKRTNSVEKYTIPTATVAINYSTNYQGITPNIPTSSSSINSTSKRESTQPTSDYRLSTQNQNTQQQSNITYQSNTSSFSQQAIKVTNTQNINKDNIQNRTSSLHNNSQSLEKSKIQPPRSSHKIKTKQDEDDQSEFQENADFQNDQYSSASRNKIDKSSRMNQVQASLSPPIKPKLMNKHQLRTPTTKFLNNFQSQDSANKFSGSDNKTSEFKQFKIVRDQKVKTTDLNERSLTIPNEDSFCDENIDEINLNQIHNAQNYSLNSNHRPLQNTQDLITNSIINNNNTNFNTSNNPNPQVLAESSRIHDRNIFNSNEKGRETSSSKDKFSKPSLTSLAQPLQYQQNISQQQQASLTHLQQSIAESSFQEKKERKQHSHNSHSGQSFPNQVFGLNSVMGQNKIQIPNVGGGINITSHNPIAPQSISSLKEELLKAPNPVNQDILKKSSTLNSQALKKIQNMGQVFQKQTKQNYFDMAKKQISQKNFQLRGLFQTYKVSREAWNDFIQILWNKPFSFYECQNLKDKNSEEVRLFQNTPNNYKSSSRILILSQEFVLSISANQQIINQLQQIKNGVKQFSIIEKVDNSFLKNKIPIILNLQKDGSSGKEDRNNFVSIKSFFFMRNLLKITSKKFNTNILSFYFKIPDVFKSQKFESTQYFQFIEKFDLFHLKEIILSKKLNEILHELYQIISDDSEKFEIKSLYNMENEFQALDCIKKSKEYYTIQQNTNIHGNLK